ncbi:MAG: acyl-CoA dehydrogenase [Rhodospirillales bacterium RIFCSPLOWO2_12_FULL_58_28]|nr:MAG: acyl-CoA dehydrogenase [Rhodospirillales bacterium RIFCSPLOWO2_12_FULL_58_28]
MPAYKAPLDDMRYVLNELFADQPIHQLPGCEETTPDLVDAVLEEAGKICATLLFPLNRSGDEEGCHFEDGQVRTPKGFKEAYKAFAEGGWTSLACAQEHGGQGLPESVNLMVEEMICSANLSFGIYPGLSRGAYSAIKTFGADALKQIYLPRLADGSWTGSMCLTEPQSGTDLGLVRTKAEPQGDGSYVITGTKIFISSGEHDLTDNIVHLVLARVPGAPQGIRGISLFLTPKRKVNADGSLGEANAVACGSIEHKMGIKASATCVLNFDGAVGYLVGELNKGMRAMFVMMNMARLSVGVQGLGVAEAAYQGAVAYARERLQGRALAGPRYPDKPADPLIVHPDIRRMLLTMRANIEGCRALAGWTARNMDIMERHADPEERRKAEDLVALLTPIVKAHLTDMGFEAANLGVQVYGGHGYIRENGMEQYVRDARITQIYEGANGIQALDLVGRKLGAHTGRYLRSFFHPVAAFIEAHQGDGAMEEFIGPLAKSFSRLQLATGRIAQKGLADPEEAAAAATDYLKLFALTALAYVWAMMAKSASAKADNDPTGFYKNKTATARFFMQRLLPQTGGLLSAIMSGKSAVMDFDEEAF